MFVSGSTCPNVPPKSVSSSIFSLEEGDQVLSIMSWATQELLPTLTLWHKLTLAERLSTPKTLILTDLKTPTVNPHAEGKACMANHVAFKAVLVATGATTLKSGRLCSVGLE